MFVRQRKNPNGLYTIQVVDKSSGRSRVVKNFGVAKTEAVKSHYLAEATLWIKQKQGTLELDYEGLDSQVQSFIDNIQSLTRSGTELLLGKIFDEIGFGQIKDPFFKPLVLYRLIYPSSKLKTTEYLYRYHQIEWSEQQVYRYMDKLYKKQKELVQRISYAHTTQVLEGQPQIVFYDVTTLYFEIEEEDELRQAGFSKDGKHQNPQIVLGLLVSRNGYPLAYDLFEGKKFEGHTMLPIVEKFITTYNLSKPIVVADAGLLSKKNIESLTEKGYAFILGGRIKNENQLMQEQILSKLYKNGSIHVFPKANGINLIVSYSAKRAGKDADNRERGIKRLEKQISKGRLTKTHINNKGYNKYLKLKGEVEVSIDYEKYKADAVWDGLNPNSAGFR